ncbi:MAG: beta-lactamase family protein [Gammaproteobacteria bacterium]|nr:beta-lactamase family protein [Gammaproteobacteria bacterium]
MKKAPLLIVMVFTLLLTNWVPIAASPNYIQRFEQEIERLRNKLQIPGLSVAILQNQEIILARGFGYADLENSIPATEHTPYNIASLTKAFSAAILMQLVEAGQLDLDVAMADILKDTLFPFRFRGEVIRGYANVCEKMVEIGKLESFPLARLFQDYHGATERITVRHHLTHTSQGVPGETYRYNGLLYGWLSLVAEEVSGKRFDELLVTNIIAPLGMSGTIPSISDSLRDQVLAERTKYYRVNDAGALVPSAWPSEVMVNLIKMGDLVADSLVNLNAGGGIISTVLDLARFDMAMDRNVIVSEVSKAAMFTPTLSNSGQSLPYGLGWIVQDLNGAKLIWHYGWAPDAYSSLILKVPEKELTLILLANSDGASAPFNLGEGNVLKSPFATTFINLFTDIETLP